MQSKSKTRRRDYLGRAAIVGPGAPSRGVGFSDVVRKILEPRSRSRNHALQEFQHLLSSTTTDSREREREGEICGKKINGIKKTPMKWGMEGEFVLFFSRNRYRKHVGGMLGDFWADKGGF